MLYDKRWDAKTETKADPLSLQSLIAWLEKQEPKTRYCYVDGGKCLLSQYFSAAGFENVFLWVNAFYHGPHPIPLMNEPDAAALGLTTKLPRYFDRISVSEPMTFGGALKRARAFAARVDTE